MAEIIFFIFSIIKKFQQIELPKVLLFSISYPDSKTKSIKNMLFLQSIGVTNNGNLERGFIHQKLCKVVYQ